MTDKVEAKKEVAYFKSTHYAGLTIVKKDGTSVRFVPHFDTYKGDKVKVGFLQTDDAEVIERCETLSEVESVSEKEFTKETTKLKKAPVYSV